MDKTLATARHLISNMASNTQQFGTRGTTTPRMVNEIVEHPTDMCPTLQETEPDHPESVGAIGGYQYGKQPYATRLFEGQQYGRPPYQGPYAAQGFSSNRSMPQSQGSYQQSNPRHQMPPFQQQQQKTPPPSNSSSLKDLVKQIVASNLEFQQTMSSNLKKQVGQLAKSVSQLQSAGSGNLPSQTIPNPRGNASVVSLRSGKELQAAPQQKPRSTSTESNSDANSQPSRQASPVPAPFPSRTLSARKPESDEELLKMFWKVENRPRMELNI
ncbi:hypothetical protein CR513_11899, partial [Mucuna pruriens]